MQFLGTHNKECLKLCLVACLPGCQESKFNCRLSGMIRAQSSHTAIGDELTGPAAKLASFAGSLISGIDERPDAFIRAVKNIETNSPQFFLDLPASGPIGRVGLQSRITRRCLDVLGQFIDQVKPSVTALESALHGRCVAIPIKMREIIKQLF